MGEQRRDGIRRFDLPRATRNALLPGRTRATLTHAPWTVLADPEVARAGEMIQEVILAMEQGKELRHLASAMHVYPTYSALAINRRPD